MAARKIDGKWYADFRFQHADGSVERVRKRSPVQSKAGADEFEHQLRTALLAPTHTTKEVLTFAVRLQARWAQEHRLARPEAHVLLAPRHERCGTQGHSGTGRAQHAHHDAQVHAPGAERAHRSDRSAQLWAAGGQCRERVLLK